MRCRSWIAREVSLRGDAFVPQSSEKIKSIAETIGEESLRHFQDRSVRSKMQTHKIHGLSARLGRTIYSVRVEGDLRALFYVARDTVVSIDIGDHRIYRAD